MSSAISPIATVTSSGTASPGPALAFGVFFWLVVGHGGPLLGGVLADAQHLPHGRCQAGDRHSNSTRPGTTSRTGLTGTNRERPGLREALAACREGDTLVVTKLDRLALSLPDARAIADDLSARQVRLNLGGSVYDPTDPVGRLLFNVLAMVAEFESDLIRLRTRAPDG